MIVKNLCWLLLLVSLSVFGSSEKLKGATIPKLFVLEETGDVLQLRGIGVYKQFFKDYYIGAFYSLNPLTTPQQALSDGGPKRMWIYFLQSTNNLRGNWEDAIIDNNSHAILQREQLSVSQFLKIMDISLHKGDVLILDYVPNIGTEVIVKGYLRGIIKGNEFYNLVLNTWMGREPPSEKFRKDLFNLS